MDTKTKPFRYKFKVAKRWLTMPDGVRLAASLYVPLTAPCPAARYKTFPVLLEYLPYRKDDTFYVVDHQCFSFFAQLGFIAVKVDIRGTGGSEGSVPECEYSQSELDDCESIIAQLAALPECNGKVGMFGISWSGFNSLQMAMRRPPALKAIHAMHASDDLYHDDLHLIDGNLHLDPYHLFINHELGLPRTPDYKLDEPYFAERFDQKPWLFTYLNNQLDGQFWRSKSLAEDYSRIDIPVYLIGGLLDGYRSAAVRMFENLTVPVRCDVGPWEHSCPDEGSPGPNFDWQIRLASWFNRYLRDQKSAAYKAVKAKEFMVFVRTGHAPDSAIEAVPGYWRKDSYPAASERIVDFHLSGPGQLTKVIAKAAASDTAPPVSLDELAYHPFAGTAAGAWWGNRTGDMAADDAFSLTYDSKPLKRPLEIIGRAHLRVKVQSTSAKAKWTVRLEDVAPDGSVMLVTGALHHPAQAKDRLDPAWPSANQPYTVDLALHFTTWTFQPGHRVRLAIANAQFPMAWPSPDLMTSIVFSGGAQQSACLSLPVVRAQAVGVDSASAAPRLPRVVEKLPSPDSEGIEFPGKPESKTFQRYNKKTAELSHTIAANSAYRIRERKFFIQTSSRWSTFDHQPWRAAYLGVAQTTIVSRGRNLRLRTRISVVSDRDNFYVTVVRTLLCNGRVVRRRRFFETIARTYQ